MRPKKNMIKPFFSFEKTKFLKKIKFWAQNFTILQNRAIAEF